MALFAALPFSVCWSSGLLTSLVTDAGALLALAALHPSSWSAEGAASTTSRAARCSSNAAPEADGLGLLQVSTVWPQHNRSRLAPGGEGDSSPPAAAGGGAPPKAEGVTAKAPESQGDGPSVPGKSMAVGLSSGRQDQSADRTAVTHLIALLQAVRVKATRGVDDTDLAWIAVAVILVGLSYTLLVICLRAETPESETVSEKLSREFVKGWAAPDPKTPVDSDAYRVGQTAVDSYPVLSRRMLTVTADVPLLLPLPELYHSVHLSLATGNTWSVDILSSARQNIFSASLAAVGSGKRRLLTIAGRSEGGQLDFVYASIDSFLVIRNSEGAPFGRLIASANDEYVLEEAGTLRSRWAIRPVVDTRSRALSSMLVLWRPSGELLASVAHHQTKQADFLKVRNSEGVDMVLVLACVLGIVAFVLTPP